MTISTTDASHSRSGSQLSDDDSNALNNKKKAKPEETTSDASSSAQLAHRQKSVALEENDDVWPTADNLPPITEHTPGVLTSRSGNSSLAESTTTTTPTATITTTTTTTTTTLTTAIHPLTLPPNGPQHSHTSSVSSTTGNSFHLGVTTWGAPSESRVVEAIKKENPAEFQQLLQDHPSLLNTVLREHDQTPLALAIESGNKKLIGHLLTCKNIDLNHAGIGGTTALHTAAAKGDLASLSLLLAAGAEPDTVDAHGATPLISAAAYGHIEIVQALLARLTKTASLNRQDRRGYTALTYATVAGNAPIVRLLLQKGAHPKVASHENKSPMIYAIECDHPEVVLALMEAGVNADKKTASGGTPLTCAVLNGHVELTKILLEMRVKFPRDQGDPIAIAAEAGHVALIALFKRHGYPIDKALATGRTPLMKASSEGHTEAVDLLISLGADLDRVDKEGKSALDITVVNYSIKIRREASHIDVIATLLAHMKGPIRISEKLLKPLMAIAIERVNHHQDWGLLREITAKGLVNSVGERLEIDLQELKKSSTSPEAPSSQ